MYTSVWRSAWGAADDFPGACIEPGAASNPAGSSKETNMRSATFRMICRLLIAPVMALSVQTARAGMIGADQASLAAAAQTERNTMLNALGRPAATSDEELDALAGKMNSLPVGGEGLVVVLLIVLLIVVLLRRR